MVVQFRDSQLYTQFPILSANIKTTIEPMLRCGKGRTIDSGNVWFYSQRNGKEWRINLTWWVMVQTTFAMLYFTKHSNAFLFINIFCISDLSSLILKCFGTNVSETTVKRACKKLGWKKSAVKYCQIAWEKNRIEQLHFARKALAEKAPFEKCQTLIP